MGFLGCLAMLLIMGSFGDVIYNVSTAQIGCLCKFNVSTMSMYMMYKQEGCSQCGVSWLFSDVVGYGELWRRYL